MILAIARHEFRQRWRDRRLLWAAILLGVLFGLSWYAMRQEALSLATQQAAASQESRRQWEQQTDKNPHSAAHDGTYVFQPAPALGGFDQGVRAFTGNVLFLEAHRMNAAQLRTADDRDVLTRLGGLTPAFVLGVLFPLFIFILGFDAMAGEKDHLNLRLLFAQGVGPGALFVGKAAGLWLAVLLLAVPFLALGAPWASASVDLWSRYLLLTMSYLIYLGCFVHLALWVSAATGRRNPALVTSLGIWICCCWLAPRFGVDLARQQYPTPSWSEYHEAIEHDLAEGVDGHDPSDAYTRRLEEETLQKYGVDSVQQLPFNWAGFVMQRGEEHETLVFQKHQNDLLARYQQQQQVFQATALTSPYLLNLLLSQKLAGADIDTYFDFLAAAERYRIQLVGELNNDLMNNFAYGDWDGVRDTSFFRANVAFTYLQPTLAGIWPQLAPLLLLLLCWWLVSGALSLLAFQRIKPI